MKNYLLLLLAVVTLASCSSPKYTYNFDHYDYNSGRKASAAEQALIVEKNPLSTNSETVVASVDEKSFVPVVAEKNETATKAEVAKKYKAMSKEERKEFRKEVKAQIKSYAKAVRSGDHGASVAATKVMDHDLKMAIIFGAVGLTLNLFGGYNSVFWVLGVIAIVIGVVFLIKWLARQ